MAKSEQAKRQRRKRKARPFSPPASEPGSLLFVDPEADKPDLRVLAYGPDQIVDVVIHDLAELDPLLATHPVVWVDVEGLGDEKLLRGLAAKFQIHPLALEDVVNTHQRAKVDSYPAHDFVVLRMLRTHDGELDVEQLGLFLGPRAILTFQEGHQGDPFEPVRQRLRQGRPQLRQGGPDVLTYALLDAVVDGYFPVLEHYGDVLERLETDVLEHPTTDLLGQVHSIKRELLRIRRVIWPIREAMAALTREQSPYVKPDTRVYLRDVHDHAVQAIDLCEALRDLCSGLTDLYLSSVSHRLNEVMKVLTIISTIFIPLSFIAGVYGMNFDPAASPWNMPELKWAYGYPFAMGLMATIGFTLLYFFHRKGWLHRQKLGNDGQG